MNSTEGGGTFRCICGNFKTLYGYKRIYCPKKKAGGNCGNGGGSRGGGNVKYCDHCKTKGHVNDGHWKLHPEQVPQWYTDMNTKSSEAAGSSVEMILVHLKVDDAQDFGGACL